MTDHMEPMYVYRKPSPLPSSYISPKTGKRNHVYGTNADGSPKDWDDPLDLKIDPVAIAERLRENGSRR